MLTDEDLMDLPDDPIEAFLHLERIARGEMDRGLAAEGDNGWTHELRYMSSVLAAAKAFNIDEIANSHFMPGYDVELAPVLVQFMRHVDYLCARLRIENAQRIKKHSVAFDAATKQKLGHLLTQVRDTVSKLEVSEAKRERLFIKIEALQLEIDRTRTRMEVLGGLVAEFAAGAEPLIDMGMKIARIFGEKKSAEDETRQLPAPKAPKQIASSKKSSKKLDDEIPF